MLSFTSKVWYSFGGYRGWLSNPLWYLRLPNSSLLSFGGVVQYHNQSSIRCFLIYPTDSREREENRIEENGLDDGWDDRNEWDEWIRWMEDLEEIYI